MTFASGSIPSCLRQDLSQEEIHEFYKDLEVFQANFAIAMCNLTLIFDR
jgi:hypothetical protein